MPTKDELKAWVETLPGVNSWYSNFKIDLWAKGVIASSMYDKWFNWFNAGDKNSILADIQRHTGTIFTTPQQTVSAAYLPIVDFLTKQLAFQRGELANYNTIPLAEDTVNTEISRTSQALAYYKSLQTS